MTLPHFLKAGGRWKATDVFAIAEDTAPSLHAKEESGLFHLVRSVPTREAESVGDKQVIYCPKMASRG